MSFTIPVLKTDSRDRRTGAAGPGGWHVDAR